MHLNRHRIAIFALAILVLTVVGLFPLVSVAASDDLQDQIEEEQQNLDATGDKLEQKSQELAQLDKKLSKVSNRLPEIELELQKIKVQITYNKLQLAYLVNASDIAELKLQQQLELQELLLKSNYASWKVTKDINRFLPPHKQTHYLKGEYYRNRLMTNQHWNTEQVQDELDKLESDYQTYAAQLAQLNLDNSDLVAKRAELKSELAALKGNKITVSGQVAGLYTRQQSIAAIISELRADQQAAARHESEIIDKKPVPPVAPPPSSSSKSSSKTTTSQTSSSTTTSNTSSTASTSTSTSSQSSTATSSASSSSTSTPSSGPTFKFRTFGRDAYQGHGVGMSQYGAYGMAKKGLTAEEILTKYYKDVEVVDYDLSEEISVKYCNNSPALDAYQDGCADGAAPVVKRISFRNYLAGLGEMPESWPIEARKAQIIAARTYAVRYTNNGDPNKPICLTSYCQVSYVRSGDKNEMGVVDATANKVIKYNGQLIEALYSADNSQGNGTAHNDTIFQDFYGNGTPYGYLRAFNDSAWATSTSWTNWSCKTRSYEYKDIDSMLKYIGTNSSVSADTKNKVQSIRNQIGKVQGIEFERDPSQRVKKVKFIGTKANATMGGWWFKNIWNQWVYAQNITSTTCFGENRYDYIYSQSIFLIPDGTN